MDSPPALRRSLSLTQLVLYGIGTTVGAGIYALIGEITAVAGYLAPWSFLAAAMMATFTAFSFARLSARYPRAAGAALYVEKGLGSPRLARGVGYLVVATGTLSSAALLNGFVGYAQEFIDTDRILIIVTTAAVLSLIAIWGIAQSVWVAGIISIVEVGGLIWVTVLAVQATDLTMFDPELLTPTFALNEWSMIFAGAVLAFYAYIGFEDMVEVAEEVREVERNLPRAIFLTLAFSSLIYLLLIGSLILAVGPEMIAVSDAPLADVYRHLTGSAPTAISVIGLFAIVNGALIQIIMASRVLYGLAARGQLPQPLARVNSWTQTPINATLVAAGIVTLLALSGTLASLAFFTSISMLFIFALVNLSLYALLRRHNRTQALISLVGALTCIAIAIHALLQL